MFLFLLAMHIIIIPCYGENSHYMDVCRDVSKVASRYSTAS